MYLCRIFFLDDRSCGLSLCSSRVLLEAKQKLAHVSVISPPRCAVTMFIPVGLSQAGGNRQTFKLLGPNCLLPQLSLSPTVHSSLNGDCAPFQASLGLCLPHALR